MTIDPDDFGSTPPEETAARRDPLASIYRDTPARRPLRDTLLGRLPDEPLRSARWIGKTIAAAAVVAAGVLLVVAVGFAAHAIWDAIMLGWRIG